jgi:hypothetical protein
MKKFLATLKKNRNLSIAIAVVIVVIVLAGVFLLTRTLGNSVSQQQVSQTPAPTDQPVLKVAPADLGITLTSGPGNQTAVLGVADTKEIVSLDYELSYMATVNGAQVARGAIGHIDIKNKGTPVKESITLGTCSDVCHYDVGVSNIAITLKITKTDGKVYQSNLTLNL